MKLVTYNIQYSLGKDGRFDLTRIAETVRGADVIALQEVHRHLEHTGMVDQATEIAAMLPEYYWAFGPSWDLEASERAPDGRIAHRRQQEGNMLLSRWPIQSARNHLLPYVGTASHINSQAAALEGVIDPGGRPLRVYALHLSHLSQRERHDQVDWLLVLNRRVWLEGGVWSRDAAGKYGGWMGRPPPPMPFDAAYLGDFNFDPRNGEYTKIVGPLDASYGRIHYRDLLMDTWAIAGHAETDGVTFPANADYPEAGAGWRLDYCFVTPSLAPTVRRAWIDNDAQGSDHQPYWVEIDV